MKAVFILSIIVSLSHFAVPYEEVVQQDKRINIEGRIEGLKENLEEIRGLKFKEKVKIYYKSREEMTSFIRDFIKREFSLKGKKGEKKALVEFGFLEEGIDLEETWAKFYAGQALGVYDMEYSTLVIVSDMLSDEEMSKYPDLTEADKVLFENFGLRLADFAFFHELDHALIDQNFNLKDLRRSAEDNFDKTLSYLALIEGEAILLNHIFIFRLLGVEKEVVNRRFSVDNIIDENSCIGFVKDISDYPSYIAALSIFPYQNGLNFVKENYLQKGWKGVNALYSSPPVSTEQILHPEKFIAKRDPPREVIMENIGTLLDHKWKQIDQNTLGEFRIRLLISHILNKDDTAYIASEGWGGDRYILFEDDQGDRILQFRSLWDSEKDAFEFYEAFLRSLQDLSFAVKNHQTMEKYQKSLRKGSIEIFISLNSNTVSMIKGPSAHIKKIRSYLSRHEN